MPRPVSVRNALRRLSDDLEVPDDRILRPFIREKGILAPLDVLLDAKCTLSTLARREPVNLAR